MNIYSWDGRPISWEEWTAARERGLRHVARTDLGARGRVSTVWLGFDHAYLGGPPLIFETMIFGGPLSGELWRYSSAAAAAAGHRDAVRLLKSWRGRPLLRNGRKPSARG